MVSPVAGYPRQHTAEISRLHGRRSPAAVLPLGVSLIMTFCLSVGGTGDCMSLFRWRACPLNMTFSTVHISLATKKNSFLESALCYFAFTEWRKPQRLLRRANQSREPCSVYRAKGSPYHRGGVLLLYWITNQMLLFLNVGCTCTYLRNQNWDKSKLNRCASSPHDHPWFLPFLYLPPLFLLRGTSFPCLIEGPLSPLFPCCLVMLGSCYSGIFGKGQTWS